MATDWFDRKLVLQLSQIGALLLNVVFAALLLLDLLELWHIYAAAAVRGTTMAFDQPARQSLIPSIVPANRVMNAVALFSATQNTMRIVGTAASGFAIAAFGVEGAFVAIAVIYVGAGGHDVAAARADAHAARCQRRRRDAGRPRRGDALRAGDPGDSGE